MNIAGADRRGPSRGFVLAVLLVLVAYVSCFTYATREYYVDDAYIDFQFLRHLLAGDGFVFCAGQPTVEGVTNIGWPLLLAPLAALSAPTVAAKLMGLLLLVASLALTVRLGWHLAARCGPEVRLSSLMIVPVLLLATSFEFVYFSVAGMETALLATILLSMVLLAVRRPDARALPLMGAFSFLVHPEAVLVYPLYALFLLGAEKPAFLGTTGLRGPPGECCSCPVPAPPISRRRLWQAVFLLATLVGAVTAGRWAIFGDVVPNTFHAKPSNGSLILYNGYCFLSGRNGNVPFPLSGWLVLPLVVLGYLRLRRGLPAAAAMLAAITATGLAFAIYSPADWTETGRYFAPYLPATLLLFWSGLSEAIGLLFSRQSQQATRELVKLAAAIMLVAGTIFGNGVKMAQMETFPGYVMAGKKLVAPALWMRDHLPADATIATRRIGALAYYSQRRVFDYTYGLTDREVARAVAAAGHRFDIPNEPSLRAIWRRRSPDYLLEDGEIIDLIAAQAGGTRQHFLIHGQPYAVLRSFSLGPGKQWILARRLPTQDG